jgi:hypothetical protein
MAMTEPALEAADDRLVASAGPRYRLAAGAARPAGDGRTREVIRRVQADGTLWLGGTTWHGMAAMRISVSNWSTTEADVDRSVAAILQAAGPVG